MNNTYSDFRNLLLARSETLIYTSHVASCIRRGKESSLEEEHLSFFISSIFEKDVSHKYVDPNME